MSVAPGQGPRHLAVGFAFRFRCLAEIEQMQTRMPGVGTGATRRKARSKSNSKSKDAGAPTPALQGNWVIVGGWRGRDGPERGEEVAGLQGLEGGEAGVEVGRGEAPIAVEQAEEFIGGAVALLGVAVEATGDDVAVGVVAQ